MSKKIKLNLDELKVQSFVTSEKVRGGVTVFILTRVLHSLTYDPCGTDDCGGGYSGGCGSLGACTEVTHCAHPYLNC